MTPAVRHISLEIPSSDLSLIEEIANRLGWKVECGDEHNEVVPDAERPCYSDRINRLRSLRGKGISQSEIDSDERLKYLLNK